MKKNAGIVILFSVFMSWPPQIKMNAQSAKPEQKSILDKKNEEKLFLFKRVSLKADSILALLNKKKIPKNQPIRYIKIYERVLVPIPQEGSVIDTLKVDKENKVVVDEPDMLPNNFYLVKDTVLPKKKNFFQRLFTRKKKII